MAPSRWRDPLQQESAGTTPAPFNKMRQEALRKQLASTGTSADQAGDEGRPTRGAHDVEIDLSRRNGVCFRWSEVHHFARSEGWKGSRDRPPLRSLSAVKRASLARSPRWTDSAYSQQPIRLASDECRPESARRTGFRRITNDVNRLEDEPKPAPETDAAAELATTEPGPEPDMARNPT